MAVKTVNPKSWTTWVRASDGYLRSDDPYGTYGGYTPNLPAATVTTTYSLPTGNTWTATNTSSSSIAGTGAGNRTDCSVPYALANCARGDIIKITKNTTYTGPWMLRNITSGSGDVYIVSTGDPGAGGTGLPAAGTRVGPADATSMAKLQISQAAGSAAIQTADNAHHYRIVGLEITVGPTLTDFIFSMVSIGNSDVSTSTLPNNITIDRCYIHGGTHATAAGRRGVAANGSSIAVIDSYISGFYDRGNDSQGVWCYQSGGPLKIYNNYIEAATENILIGGSDPEISGNVPSDIEIRKNTLFKPTAWLAANLTVKNLFELKNCQRVLVEGNLMENVFPNGQTGFAVLFTVRNQDGGAPWSVVQDVTFRYNKIINAGSGFSITGTDSIQSSQQTTRILIEHNLFDITGYGGATAKMFQMTYGPRYLTIQNNTGFTDSGITTSAIMYADELPKTTNFIFQNNLFSHGAAGFGGAASVTVDGTLTDWFSNPTFLKNVLIGAYPFGTGSMPGSPTGNFLEATMAGVGFTDISGAFSANNYTLTGGSAYHNAGTDGADIGCDIAALNAALPS